jgi:hypothetical protein
MDLINLISKAPGCHEDRFIGGDHCTDGSPYSINGLNVHACLREMKEKVLRHYNPCKNICMG